MENGALGLLVLIPAAIVIGCVVVSEKPADSAPPPPLPVTAAPVQAAEAAPAPAPIAASTSRPHPVLRSRRPTTTAAGVEDGGTSSAAADAGLPLTWPADASLEALPR